MLSDKDISVIRTCLKCMRAFGNEKSKSDIEETLKNFDKDIKKQREVKKKYEEFKEAKLKNETIR